MKSLRILNKKGFTLIELMIVVAIIGILAAVAIPKFADLVTKSKEAAIKGSLGAVRSAASIYYGDSEGDYPDELFQALTGGNKYLPSVGGVPSLGKFAIPANENNTDGHKGVIYANASHADAVNSGALSGVAGAEDAPLYQVNTGASTGEIYINCSHGDTKGVIWTAY